MSRTDSDKIKIIAIGDSGVGKTSIIKRYCLDAFSVDLKSTIALDLIEKTVDLCGRSRNLCFWDTSGQERYDALSSSYFRGAHGVILVYDVTDVRTFDRIKAWMEKVDDYCDRQSTKLILLANKCDLEGRVVDTDMGTRAASLHGMMYFEVSAKTNQHIQIAMQNLVMSIVQSGGFGGINGRSGDDLDDTISLVEYPNRKHGKQKEDTSSCCNSNVLHFSLT
eukprot:TRINITY_DN6484_c0_g1_i3.p1 TRINITY_DN6484_c0_g1~~TRINITY_DN6484_c0_g1_i3.p1  ORF type:complete len:222 (-),score=24.55 TRINITY_DN6484_c0_g1_i3:394-1059(-)